MGKVLWRLDTSDGKITIENDDAHPKAQELVGETSITLWAENYDGPGESDHPIMYLVMKGHSPRSLDFIHEFIRGHSHFVIAHATHERTMRLFFSLLPKGQNRPLEWIPQKRAFMVECDYPTLVVFNPDPEPTEIDNGIYYDIKSYDKLTVSLGSARHVHHQLRRCFAVKPE